MSELLQLYYYLVLWLSLLTVFTLIRNDGTSKLTFQGSPVKFRALKLGWEENSDYLAHRMSFIGDYNTIPISYLNPISLPSSSAEFSLGKPVIFGSGSFLVWSFSGIIHIIPLPVFTFSPFIFICIHLHCLEYPWKSLNPWISVATRLCCLPCPILPSLESLPIMVSSLQNFHWRCSRTLIMPNGRTLLGISTLWY